MIAPDGTVYVDNTILRCAASCSLHTVLRHVLHQRNSETGAALRAGTAAHEALAAYFTSLAKRQPPDTSVALGLAAFAEHYEQWANENVLNEDRLAFSNLHPIMSEWMETRHSTALPFFCADPNEVEVGFAYPLDESGKYVFFWRIDLIGHSRHDGKWYIVDHKTTGRIDQFWAGSFRLDTQVTGYLWAALQHNPDVQGVYINGLEFRKLNSSDTKCRVHGMSYADCRLAPEHLKFEVAGPIHRTVEQMERWRVNALALAQKYEHYALNFANFDLLQYAEMEGPFTNACRFCDFQEFCSLGQHPEQLPALGFVYDEWMPYNPLEVA